MVLNPTRRARVRREEQRTGDTGELGRCAVDILQSSGGAASSVMNLVSDARGELQGGAMVREHAR